MHTLTALLAVSCAAELCAAGTSLADSGDEAVHDSRAAARLLGPHPAAGPVEVRAAFQLTNIDTINDEQERFEFAGVLTLTWHDPRQAFDAAAEGVEEKTYQGDYQFNEISPAWYPQIILANGSDMFETRGVVLKSRPDGSQRLIQPIHAAAKADFNMRRFPFDHQPLEAVFEVLGYDLGEVVLRTDPAASTWSMDALGIPQWRLVNYRTSIRDREAPYAGRQGTASAFVVSIDAQRKSFFIVRLVVIPLAMIVLLSFSVFWMDRSSLGDRINVSFIGILTGVAYQIVMSELLPRISYVTLMNGFLNISFLMMSATVVVNLVVGALDQKGMRDAGDRLDRKCRWIFPLTYVGLNLAAFSIAMTLF